MKHTKLFLLVVLFLTSCAAPTTLPPTSTLTFAPEPTATQTPIPTEAPLSDEPLIPEAQRTCEEAFSAAVVGGSPQLSVLTLLRETEGKWVPWDIATSPDVEAQSASEVRTLVCIEIDWLKVGTYTNGRSALQAKLVVRLVNWPDGQVLNEKEFLGSPPPDTITTVLGGMGDIPVEELINWVKDTVH